jgi:hypothetical protein
MKTTPREKAVRFVAEEDRPHPWTVLGLIAALDYVGDNLVPAKAVVARADELAHALQTHRKEKRTRE